MKSVGRTRLRAAMLLGCAGLSFAPAAALAQSNAEASASASYTIPAQQLGDALTQLGRESGREIIFPSGLVEGRSTAGVAAPTSFERALDALLQGSGLVWRENASGTILIERPQQPAANEGADEEEIIVTARNPVTGERSDSVVAVDILTSEDMSRYVATDVADVVVRMPGVSTTQRGSFAVVRGLSERYNPVLMDGFVMPSTDPERQMPPLDLFPTRLVESIAIGKVFEPSMPATASGGSVALRTPTLPNGRFFQFQVGARADEGYFSGEDFYSTNYGGHWDVLGLGARDRPGRPATHDEMVDRWSSPDFQPIPSLSDYPIGLRFGFVAEDRIDLGNDGRALGYSLSFGYDSSASSEAVRSVNAPFGGVYDGSYREEFEQQVRIGVLGKVGYAFNDDHALGLSVFLSQEGLETASLSSGFEVYDYQPSTGFENGVAYTQALFDLVENRIVIPADGVYNTYPFSDTNTNGIIHEPLRQYRERNLTNITLSGEHAFREGDTQMNWSAARITATQDEPDVFYFRYVERVDVNNPQPPEGPLGSGYQIFGGHPGRQPTSYWRNVEEQTSTARLDLVHAFDLGWMSDVRFRAGVLWEDTTRTHRETTRAILTTASAPTLDDLIDGFGGSLGSGGNPRGDAERSISAGYASLTLPLLAEQSWAERLDFTIGARMEDFQLVSDGFGNVGNDTSWIAYVNLRPLVEAAMGADLVGDLPVDRTDFLGTIDEQEIYPSAALTWSPIDRLNLRLSFSETTARPSFRETGSYYTRDEIDFEWQHGNAYLQPSPVTNIDFRVEYFFPGGRDLVAFSLFDKQIENPIERTRLVIHGVSRNTISWVNNPNEAHLRGAEFELAKNLGFLGAPGDWFTFGVNGAWIDGGVDQESRTRPGEIEERPLADQPEWIGNAYLMFEPENTGFSATLSYFAISDVLYTSVVGDGTPTYVAAHDRLDLVMNQRLGDAWSLRFSASNLLDPERHFVADPIVVSSAPLELNYEFGFGREGDRVITREWRDGRSLSITLTREF